MPARAGDRAGRGAGVRGCSRAPSRADGPSPPGRQQRRRTRPRRARGAPSRRNACARSVSRSSVDGRGVAQRASRSRVEPAGPAQLGEQRLLRRVEPAGQRLERARRAPDPFGVDDEAGLVGRLQRELEPPAVRLVLVRFDQPEAGPDRAAHRVPLPAGQVGGQPGHRGRVRVEAALRTGKRPQPGVDGRARPSGHDRVPGQRRAYGRVNQVVEGGGEYRPRPGGVVGGPPGRWQRPGQRLRPARVGAGQYRSPGRRGPGLHGRQYPSAGHQVRREPGHGRQVAQRRPGDGGTRVRAVAQGRERLVGRVPQHRHGPAAGGHRGAGPARLLVADEFERRLWRAARGGQRQGGGAGGRVARPGGERGPEVGGGRGERVRHGTRGPAGPDRPRRALGPHGEAAGRQPQAVDDQHARTP